MSQSKEVMEDGEESYLSHEYVRRSKRFYKEALGKDSEFLLTNFCYFKDQKTTQRACFVGHFKYIVCACMDAAAS